MKMSPSPHSTGSKHYKHKPCSPDTLKTFVMICKDVFMLRFKFAVDKTTLEQVVWTSNKMYFFLQRIRCILVKYFPFYHCFLRPSTAFYLNISNTMIFLFRWEVAGWSWPSSNTGETLVRKRWKVSGQCNYPHVSVLWSNLLNNFKSYFTLILDRDVVRIIPICLTFLLYWTAYSQSSSTYFIQGIYLDRPNWLPLSFVQGRGPGATSINPILPRNPRFGFFRVFMYFTIKARVCREALYLHNL